MFRHQKSKTSDAEARAQNAEVRAQDEVLSETIKKVMDENRKVLQNLAEIEEQEKTLAPKATTPEEVEKHWNKKWSL